MRDKQIIKSFFSGFLSVFRFRNARLPQRYSQDIANYVLDVENYINISYRKLKNDHEGN